MDAVKISSWTIAVVVAVVLIMRQTTKAMILRKVGLDDGFILLAFVFAISLSVTTLALAADSHDSSTSLTSEQAETILKGYYASELFYVSAVCFSKLSLLVLFYKIVAGKRLIRRGVLTLGIFIVTWTLVSLVTVAAQCGLPRPWALESSYCISARIFWTIYCTTDVLTEIALVTISAKIASCTQMRLSHKIVVVSCFIPRLLIVGAAVTRLVWLYPLATQHNHQHRVWEPMIASQVETCLSIITASVPFIVPYCRELDSRLQASTLKEPSRRIQDEETGSSRSSLWFRRHSKSKDVNSRESPQDRTGGYELLPRASTSLSFTKSMTPRSTIGLQFLPEEKGSNKGLNIYIPHRSPTKHGNELVSPRTHSSGVWSPWSTSPQALLLHSFVPSRRAPIPPPKTPSISPPSPSSCYSSCSATPALSTPPTQPSLLSPLHQSEVETPSSRTKKSLLLSEESARGMRSMIDHEVPHSAGNLSLRTPPPRGCFSHRLSQHIPTPHSGAKSRLQTAPLSTLSEEKSRPESIQDLTSPMGAAIHSWFNSPNTQRLPQCSPFSPVSPRHSFDQQTASPAESLPMPTYPPFTHTRSPARSNVFLNEPSPSQNFSYPSQASEMQANPLVRDVRNNPCVVVRNVL